MSFLGKIYITQFLLGVGVCMLTQDTNKNETKNMYAACFQSQSQGSQPTSSECIKAFTMFAQDMKEIFQFEKEEINYLWSLEREAQSLFYNHHRRKRQAVALPVRKECRLLSQYERQNLFDAIRSLKMDTYFPNEYDTLANLHRGRTIFHAHYGSNFLGWHRVYLMYYEIALRRRRAGVTLCFWDTTMEFNLGMANWDQSKVFSSDFFGNSRGRVISGPFRNWPLPENLNITYFLVRNLGNSGGIPFDTRAASSIFYNSNTISHSSVTYGGFGFDTITNKLGVTRQITIEGEHNNVHRWVGGIMGLLDAAPQDPIFFFHHCYIDYVWEKFREKMRNYGRDPTMDYPGHGDQSQGLHAAYYPMIGFEQHNYRNIDGYSDYFTTYVYRYESPTCQTCYSSPYTLCGQGYQCIARINPQRHGSVVFASNVQGGGRMFVSSPGRAFVATSNSE